MAQKWKAEEKETKERKKGSSFWTLNRAFVLFVFIFGLLIGGFLMHQYIEPALQEKACQDYNALMEKNQQLDEEVDNYYDCLVDFNINPQQC